MPSIGTSRYTSNPLSVAYTSTAGRIGPLAPGTYSVVASTDAYFLQGDASVTATAASNPAFAKITIELTVQGTADNYLSFVQVAAAGTAWASCIR